MTNQRGSGVRTTSLKTFVKSGDAMHCCLARLPESLILQFCPPNKSEVRLTSNGSRWKRAVFRLRRRDNDKHVRASPYLFVSPHKATSTSRERGRPRPHLFGMKASPSVISILGDVSGSATVDYQTTDTDTFTVGCAAKQGQAFGRCDFATTVGTFNFAAGETSKSFAVPVINDSYGEGSETFSVVLSNAVGASLGATSTATVTINDNDAVDGPNPIVNASFFVRQHYLDFLGREPEAGEPWSAVLNGCVDSNNTDANSPAANCDRITVSGSFFGSPEFRDKGIYLIDFYRTALNRLPTYAEFSVDLASITASTAGEANAKRAAFAGKFAQRADFTTAYGAMTNTAFVNAVMGGSLGQVYNLASITTYDPMNPDGPTKMTFTISDLVNGLNSNTLTRAQVLRSVVQSDEISLQREAVNAFVASQYYGYLRRTPDAAGFQAWVNYLNVHPADFRTMVNGFLNSAEYKLRFGP